MSIKPGTMSASPVSLWSTTLNNLPAVPTVSPIRAGNYIAYFDDLPSLMLVNILTGAEVVCHLPNVTSPKHLFYYEGMIIIVDDASGWSLTGYHVSKLIQQDFTPHWPSADYPKVTIPNENSANFMMSDGLIIAEYIKKSEPYLPGHKFLMPLAFDTGQPFWINSTETAPVKITFPKHFEASKESELSNEYCANDEALFVTIGRQLFGFNKAYGDRRFPRNGMVNKPTDLPSLSLSTPIYNTEKNILAYSEEATTTIGGKAYPINSIYAFEPMYGDLAWTYADATATNPFYKISYMSPDLKQMVVFAESVSATQVKSVTVQIVDTNTGKGIFSSPIALSGVTAVANLESIFTAEELQVMSIDNTTAYTIKLDKPTLPPNTVIFPSKTGFTPMLMNGTVISASSATTSGTTSTIEIECTGLKNENNASYFDGANTAIAFDSISTLNFGVNDFTVEFWMRSAEGGQVFSSTGSGTIDFRVNANPSGNVALAITKGTHEKTIFQTKSVIVTDGEWHHIAIVIKAQQGLFYVDGIHALSSKVQYYNSQKYYNDDYIIAKSTLASGPKYLTKQIPRGGAKAPAISIAGVTGFKIAAGSGRSPGFTGLLRELRIWNNAVSVDKINSRMFKILGPAQSDTAANGTTQPGNAIKGKEPKMVVNVHMDKSQTTFPAQLAAEVAANPATKPTASLINDVSLTAPQPGTFTYPCSTVTDLNLELSGFPYLLDKDKKEWPYEQHWAIRGEHAVTTDVALSDDGVLCFGASNYLYGVHKFTGKTMWSIAMANFSNPVATSMGFLVIQGGNLNLIHAQTGEWQVIGGASNTKTDFPVTFQSNQCIAADGSDIVYAVAGGGVSLIAEFSTVSVLQAPGSQQVSNIQTAGTCVYWCNASGSGTSATYTLSGYDLETSSSLFTGLAVSSPEFAVNRQHLYALSSTGVAVYDAQIGGTALATQTAITSVSGIAISESGNQVIVTQNGVPGTSPTPGKIYGLTPAKLTKLWPNHATFSNAGVHAPVISGRNVFVTAKDGSVGVFDISNGQERASFTVENRIESAPLVDCGTVYFGCADWISTSSGTEDEIDGAVHQILFGETDALRLNGASCCEISNSNQTSLSGLSWWENFNPMNACFETWVNLKKLTTQTESGIVSIANGDSTNGYQLQFYLGVDQTIYFEAQQFGGTSPGSIKFSSKVSGLVPIAEWCHIALNMSTASDEPTVQLLVNGKPQHITIGTASTFTTCPTGFQSYLGANLDTTTQASAPTATRMTHGLLGYFRIWDSRQEVTQISDRMHTQLIGTEEELLLDWNFDQLRVRDAAGYITSGNSFEVTAIGTPNYVLSELNLTKPNYPYLTYRGGKYKKTTSGKHYEYKLDVYTHKADGSPLAGQNIMIWFTEGGGSSIQISKDKSTWSTIDKEDGLSNQHIHGTHANRFDVTTDDIGRARVYIKTKVEHFGPGLDIYSGIIPSTERFHVNTLVNRQELKIVPPPTIHAQGELIQDYHYSTGGTIDASRQKGVYRTILQVQKPDKTPLTNEMVVIYADSPQEVYVEGKPYQINSQNGATFYTNATGELMVDADAKDLKAFMLEVWAGFMHKNDRVKYSVSEAPHKRLSGITSSKLTSPYTQSWSGTGPVPAAVDQKPLLAKQYKSSSSKVSHSLRHLMAASSPPKSGQSSAGASSTDLSDSETASTQLSNPNPAMRQHVGNPMPDKLADIRTLTYINRKKTMDLHAMKKSVLAAAGTTDKPVVGFRIKLNEGTNSGSGTDDTTGTYNSVELDYLDETKLALAKQGKSIHPSSGLHLGEDLTDALHEIEQRVEHAKDDLLGGILGDLWDDAEDVAEDAAHAFEDLVKKAEGLVLDLTSDVEAAITGVLDHLGPIGHMMADAVEKAMAVVDKVIEFVAIVIEAMIEFLMLLFAWEHIVKTHTILLNQVFTPAMAKVTDLLSDVSTAVPVPKFIGAFKNGIEAIELGTPMSKPSVLKTSTGDLKATYPSSHEASSAHGVQAKSLVHKTQTHSSHARTGFTGTVTSSGTTLPTGSSIPGIIEGFSSSLTDFDFSASLSPLTKLINAPYKQMIPFATSDVWTDLESILGDFLPASEFETINDIIDDPLEIPFISALYSFITGGSNLSINNLGALVAAVPVVVVYEVWATINDKTGPDIYFDHNCALPTTLNLPDFSSLSATTGGSNTELLDQSGSGSAASLPSAETLKDMAIVYSIFGLLGQIFGAVADYRTFQDLQTVGGEGAKVDKTIGLFRSLAGFSNLIGTALNTGINLNLNEAIKANAAQAPEGYPDLAKLKAYAAGCNTSTVIAFLITLMLAARDMLAVRTWIKPGPSSYEPDGGRAVRAILALIGGGFLIEYVAENDIKHVKYLDSAESNPMLGQNLSFRASVFYTASVMQMVATTLICPKILTGRRKTSKLFEAFATAQVGINTLAVLMKLMNEVAYSAGDHLPSNNS